MTVFTEAKREVFLLASIVVFAFGFLNPVFAAEELVVGTESSCAEGSGRDYSYRTIDNETEPPVNLSPVCFMEAFFNLFLGLVDVEEENKLSVFSSFLSCLSGCVIGADRCEDLPDELSIYPSSATKKPGEFQTFLASDGTAPYEFSLKYNNSGASLIDKDNGTAYYTAGETEAVDSVQVKDGGGITAAATVTVTDNPVTNVFSIDQNGGICGPVSGFSIEFPEGALDTATTCTITLDDDPEAFPSSLDNASQVFNVDLGAELELVLPVKITFNNIASSAEGSLGIYILEDGEWAFAGGMQAETTVYSYVRDLSLFRVGKGESLHKALDFTLVGSGEATVSVAEYAIKYPAKDLSISKYYAWPVTEERTAYFPLGGYQFCVEWYDDVYKWNHRVYGAGHSEYNYILSEAQTPPPVVFNLIGGTDGRCPDCENMTP